MKLVSSGVKIMRSCSISMNANEQTGQLNSNTYKVVKKKYCCGSCFITLAAILVSAFCLFLFVCLFEYF